MVIQLLAISKSYRLPYPCICCKGLIIVIKCYCLGSLILPYLLYRRVLAEVTDNYLANSLFKLNVRSGRAGSMCMPEECGLKLAISLPFEGKWCCRCLIVDATSSRFLPDLIHSNYNTVNEPFSQQDSTRQMLWTSTRKNAYLTDKLAIAELNNGWLFAWL